MLKITKKSKKILAIIIAFITIFSIMQPVVLAVNETISGSGNATFMARQYATKMRTTDSEHNTENRNNCKKINKNVRKLEFWK